jgi:hypothetical protein
LPGIVNAQFTYTVTNNTVTITAYTGPGGAVNVPGTINGLPVVSIQQLAFDPVVTGNSAIVTSVVIPDSVTNIGLEAFDSCDSLTNVTFGVGVASIGFGTFTYCISLIAITADPANPVFTTMNGVLFDKNQTTLIQCPQKLAGNYIIPDSVTNIGWSAFYGCASLTNVMIGKGLTAIGPYAFYYCTGLTSVTIPDGVTTISSAFGFCSGLTSVTIGRGVTDLGGGTFSSCFGLTNVSIPTNVTNLGNSAFSGCTGLTSISIPGNVISVGANAFADCTGLTNLTIGNGVVSIGTSAFADCLRLNTVFIPQSVTSIGATPFSSCSGLTAITVDASNADYSSVAGVLFDKSVRTLIEYPKGRAGSYTMPNSVTNIVADAFQYCRVLTNLTVDAGVTEIPSEAFIGCTNLAAVYFRGNAPIGPYAFGGDPPVGVDPQVNTIAYYLPGTSGWSSKFAGIPTALWHLPGPTVLTFEPNFGVRTNNFGFTVSWATNIPVQVDACTNLGSPVWSSLATLMLSNGSAYFSDAQWTNYPERFYYVHSP